MFKSPNFLKVTILALVGLSLLLVSNKAEADPADSLDLSAWISDVVTHPGQPEVAIELHLANYHDTVAGFQFMIRMDQPHLAAFLPTVDTVGSPITGWAIQAVRYNDFFMKVVGHRQASLPPGFGNLDPQDGLTPLMRLLVEVLPMDDTVSIAVAQVALLTGPVDNFIVADPRGAVIGLLYDTIVDTNYYVCNSWVGVECIDSTQVAPGGPYDFIHVSTKPFPYLDTARVSVQHGDLTIVRCGNFDGSADNRINLVDITAMISFVYMGGDDPALAWSANVDASATGRVNLADITKLISHVYVDHVELTCE